MIDPPKRSAIEAIAAGAGKLASAPWMITGEITRIPPRRWRGNWYRRTAGDDGAELSELSEAELRDITGAGLGVCRVAPEHKQAIAQALEIMVMWSR